MKNNNLWTTIVVALIVAVVASVLTVMAMRNSDVGLAPALSKGDNIAAPVRAHSCDADQKCEVNDLAATGQVRGSSLSVTNGNNDALSVLNKVEANLVRVNRGLCSQISADVIDKTLETAGNGPGDNGIHLKEGEKVYKGEFFVIPGHLLEARTIYNSSSGFADDEVRLYDVVSQKEQEWKATSEGTITDVNYDGVSYTIRYFGASIWPEEDRWIEVDYPQTDSHAKMDLSICF